MCLLSIQFQMVPGAPVLLAFNREEHFDRPGLPPVIDPGPPRFVGGRDQRAGGTWLGINRYGLIVGVTNRLKSTLPANPRSRGLLCLELLASTDVEEAVQHALAELDQERYAGINLVCLDRQQGVVVHGGDEMVLRPLTPGWHFITNGDLDDLHDSRLQYARRLFLEQAPANVDGFLTTAEFVCSRRAENISEPTIVLRGEDRGTVSSTLLALTERVEHAVYRFAAGPPDRSCYEDYSPLLREVLAGA